MECHKQKMATKNLTVMRLFREIFSSEQMIKIYDEDGYRNFDKIDIVRMIDLLENLYSKDMEVKKSLEGQDF